jgi:hypothetical protein
MPLGLRNATAQVRNQELRLAKAREVLGLQELEISHELANAFQTLAWRYQTAQTNFNRRRAAERQLQAFEAEFDAGTKTLDLLLQAQTRLAQAETAYFTSVVNYNKAITDLHFRKGTLLENDNVHLAEGMWTPEAYKDALRKAWARTYAIPAADSDPVDHYPLPFATDNGVSGVNAAPTAMLPAPYDEGTGVPTPAPAEGLMPETDGSNALPPPGPAGGPKADTVPSAGPTAELPTDDTSAEAPGFDDAIPSDRDQARRRMRPARRSSGSARLDVSQR